MCVGYMQLLCYFIQGTWACMDFGIHREPGTNPPQTLRNDCLYCQLFSLKWLTSFILGKFSAKYLSLTNHSLSVVLSSECGVLWKKKKKDTLAYYSNSHTSVLPQDNFYTSRCKRSALCVCPILSHRILKK